MPICFKLLMHFARAAAPRTFCTAGNSSPIRMAMMAITTSSSIKVKALRRFIADSVLSVMEKCPHHPQGTHGERRTAYECQPIERNSHHENGNQTRRGGGIGGSSEKKGCDS